MIGLVGFEFFAAIFGEISMSTNRIGELCWYCKFDHAKGGEYDWRRGFLRSWGQDHVEFDGGIGPIPVGVIEDKISGRCHSVGVEQISFAAESPARKSASQAPEQVDVTGTRHQLSDQDVEVLRIISGS